VANPLATILSAAMMLDHLGERQAARAIKGSVVTVLAAGSVRTPDLGGSNSTEEVAAAVVANLDAAVASER
jgi:tartrate dehydrogenase/decarboxylase/D-malate dehydrogenase